MVKEKTKMKKILSLVMALAMVLGCFAMAETTSILDADMDELLVLDRESSLNDWEGEWVFSYSLKNGKKYVLQRIKALFQYKERFSLFDDATTSSNRYVFTLTIISCVLSGLYIYEYISETDFMLIRSVSNGLMLGIYIGMSLFYISFKWVAYQFVNWIFFDKERNNYWIQTYFDLVSGISFLLFPVMLLIIYFNLGIQTSKVLIVFLLLFAKILLFYKSIRNFFKHVYGFLHFILYFCALEIIPLILFWKGITYINNILVLKI